MSDPNPTTWRDRLPGRGAEAGFNWRGQEVSRLENLADAAFGFSVTLLVVALEVPRDVPGLVRVVQQFPAFVGCFAILMVFWNAHYAFFRRYGLEDGVTKFLNYLVLLLVIFSVYPLKFLFSAWLDGIFGFGGATHAIRTFEELNAVYRSYGAGLALTWGSFGLLYAHAYRLRDRLGLSAAEVLHTRASLAGFGVCVAVCLLSIGLTFTAVSPRWPGLAYTLIGPGVVGARRYYLRRIRALLTG